MSSLEPSNLLVGWLVGWDLCGLNQPSVNRSTLTKDHGQNSLAKYSEKTPKSGGNKNVRFDLLLASAYLLHHKRYDFFFSFRVLYQSLNLDHVNNQQSKDLKKSCWPAGVMPGILVNYYFLTLVFGIIIFLMHM